MQRNPYYDPLFASFYDFIIEKIGLQDLELELWKFCAQLYGDPILEMGCGTGRIIIPLAEIGFKVMGLDISDHMLKILEEKIKVAPSEIKNRINWKRSDMIDPPIEKSDFKLIIFCGSQFLHLKNDDERLACLKSCRRLLKDDNSVIIISNNHLNKGIQRGFKSKTGKPEDKWTVKTRRTWKKGIYFHYFKILPKMTVEKDHLFWWKLYPVKYDHMKKLIEKADLKCDVLPQQLPSRANADIFICKKA